MKTPATDRRDINDTRNWQRFRFQNTQRTVTNNSKQKEIWAKGYLQKTLEYSKYENYIHRPRLSEQCKPKLRWDLF